MGRLRSLIVTLSRAWSEDWGKLTKGGRCSHRNKCGAKRIKEFKVRQNEKRHREDLDILKERREIASIRESHYKQKLEGYYNKHVRPSTFKPGAYNLEVTTPRAVVHAGDKTSGDARSGYMISGDAKLWVVVKRMIVKGCPIVIASCWKGFLGAYNLGVATPRALVHVGDKTSGDARSWYMISRDAKSWVVIVLHIFTVILHNCPLVKRMIVKIMPPRMTTRSDGRPAAASRGGVTGGRAGRGGGRTRGRFGDRGNGGIYGQCGLVDGQGGQVGGQGTEVNDGVDRVPDFFTIIAQHLQNLLPTILAQVGSQGSDQGNGVLACNPKEYDVKGGAIVYTRWIKKMESIQDMSGCRDNQKVKYIVGSFVVVKSRYGRGGHAAYTDRFHELAKLVPHLVTPESKRAERYIYGLAPQIRGMVAATEPSIIQKAVQIASTLTDEALRNRPIKKP
ncbi:hypothetical protein Tco_0294842 [Tanacetum coccineum]